MNWIKSHWPEVLFTFTIFGICYFFYNLQHQLIWHLEHIEYMLQHGSSA